MGEWANGRMGEKRQYCSEIEEIGFFSRGCAMMLTTGPVFLRGPALQQMRGESTDSPPSRALGGGRWLSCGFVRRLNHNGGNGNE